MLQKSLGDGGSKWSGSSGNSQKHSPSHSSSCICSKSSVEICHCPSFAPARMVALKLIRSPRSPCLGGLLLGCCWENRRSGIHGSMGMSMSSYFWLLLGQNSETFNQPTGNGTTSKSSKMAAYMPFQWESGANDPQFDWCFEGLDIYDILFATSGHCL